MHHQDEDVPDCDKEQARTYRRTQYTINDWKRHRNVSRYFHSLSTVPQSRIVRTLLRHVIMISSIACGIGVYQALQQLQWLPAWAPSVPLMPMEPFTLTSFAISLLLVFRTNTAYSRWKEGRRAFGRITTVSRDLCREMLALCPRKKQSAKELLARWVLAFTRSVKWKLRDKEPLEAELRGILSPEELRSLLASPHPINYCALVLSHTIATAGLDERSRILLLNGLASMTDASDTCYRLLNTPIPLSYTRHTNRCLILWLLLLPFGLWPICGWGTVAAVALISFVLLGIEEIGTQIEEPFSILALKRMCQRLDQHIADMMAMDSGAYAVMERSKTPRQQEVRFGQAAAPAPVPVAMCVQEVVVVDGAGGNGSSSSAGSHSQGSNGSSLSGACNNGSSSSSSSSSNGLGTPMPAYSA